MSTDLFDPPAKAKIEVPEIDDRQTIVYHKAEAYLGVEEAVPPLIESGEVYARCGRLVQVLHSKDTPTLDDDIERDGGAPVISDVSQAHLWEILSRCAAWVKYDARAKKHVGCEPPGNVVSALHTRGHWDHMPELRGVSTVPILRPAGSVVTTPGFDPVSGIFYAPNCPEPVIPGSPSRHDAEEAAEKLLLPVSQFPWAENFHASAWISTVLARVARPAFTGGVPLCLIDSNTPGTGKTKLVDASSIISTGLLASHGAPVTDDDEMRKRITSHLRGGDQICLIDNMPGGCKLFWPSLDGAITSDFWGDRELGKNTQLRLPMTAMWFVTGNNIGIGGDMGRRTIRIRIQTDVPNPELRTGFKCHPLLDYLRENRPFLLGYALTVVRAYLLAGRPSVGLDEIGSFEGWSSVVRSSIVWAGLPDPALAFANREVSLDEDAEAHIALMREWAKLEIPRESGISAAKILEQTGRRHDELAAMDEAIQVLCPTRDGELPNTRRFGRALKAIAGRVRVVDGKEMRIVSNRGWDNMASWVLVVKCAENDHTIAESTTKKPGLAGFAGSLQPTLPGVSDDTPYSLGETDQANPANPGSKSEFWWIEDEDEK